MTSGFSVPGPYASKRISRRSVRENSRPGAGTALGSPATAWNSRAVRARYTRGVLSATCGAVKSGTVRSRISLSSVPPEPAASTVMRSSIFPGGASKTRRCGAVAGAADGERPLAPVSFGAGAGPTDASAASGDRPRNTRFPSDVAASSDTRPGCSRRTPPPSAGPCGGSGSQISVTRVLPFSPRSVPIQVRTYFPDCTDGAMDASAVCTGLATSGVGLLIFSTSAGGIDASRSPK